MREINVRDTAIVEEVDASAEQVLALALGLPERLRPVALDSCGHEEPDAHRLVVNRLRQRAVEFVEQVAALGVARGRAGVENGGDGAVEPVFDVLIHAAFPYSRSCVQPIAARKATKALLGGIVSRSWNLGSNSRFTLSGASPRAAVSPR